jgi:hypothetical protein
MLCGPSRYESGQNKINLDTVIYLTFVTKFSFSFTFGTFILKGDNLYRT